MSLGGGTFVTQNKVLPGTYINFISVEKASAALSDRGIAALPVELDWGADQTVFSVESGEFETNSMKLFGYAYDDPKLKGMRDLFLNAKQVFFYRLNSGEKATCDYASAVHSGTRGNDLKIVISKNVDNEEYFDVTTYLGTSRVDQQTVSKASELTGNDYVIFKDKALAESAGTLLTGGTNGTVTGERYQEALSKLEEYSFHALGCLSTEESIKKLFVSYTRRLRDEEGMKFQTIVHDLRADYEGVINVKNKVTDTTFGVAALVYWVLGAEAGCEVNKTVTNKRYDGEFAVDSGYKQSELRDSILAGEFVLHKDGDELRVLSDINSFITVTKEKNSDFTMNQTIRVLDQIGNDIAVLFNESYLGKVQNNQAGRNSLWGDIVTYMNELERIGAIEDFESEDVSVGAGNLKKTVLTDIYVTPVNAMEQLYMTVYVN